MTKQELLGFDTIRAIAALLVFAFHFYTLGRLSHVAYGPVDFTPVLQAGHIGLDMFFVLSGFLIFRSIYCNGVNERYFKRRFLRIAPIYYYSVALCLLLRCPELFHSVSGWRNILSHLLFLQSADPVTYYGINPVLWSLSIEMIFYAFLPIFFLFTKKNALRIVTASVLMIAITYVFRLWIMQFYPLLTSEQSIIFTENFFGLLDHFAFGILASFATLRLAETQVRFRFVAFLLLIAGIVGICYGVHYFAVFGAAFRNFPATQVFLHSLVAASTALILFAMPQTFRFVQRLIANPVLKWIGFISYSFYIWHFLIIERLILAPLDSRTLFALSLCTTLVVSTITYYFIERPFLLRKKY